MCNAVRASIYVICLITSSMYVVIILSHAKLLFSVFNYFQLIILSNIQHV